MKTLRGEPVNFRICRAISVRGTLGAVLAIALCALAGPRASLADTPDAATILKSAAAAYQNLKTYEAQIIIQSVDGPNVAERHFTETGSGNSFLSEDADPRGLLRVSDGHTEFTLDRASNEYAKSMSPAPGFIGALAQIDKNVKDAALDDEELYWTSGSPVKVYIVDVTRTSWPADALAGAQSAIYTIDAQSFEVYKAITYTNTAAQIALYTLTQRNQPVTASLFAFTPPTSAKQLNSLAPQPVSYHTILGTEAPDFSLRDPAGRAYSLHDFRGRVVVIDFVGSWCPPCLAQMPYLQQMNDTYPPADLEVFGLDIGEDTKQVGEFTTNSEFTFPLLVGAEPEVTAKYFVADYPTTYVIDRAGRIAFKVTGTDNPGGLLSAVKSAVAKK